MLVLARNTAGDPSENISGRSGAPCAQRDFQGTGVTVGGIILLREIESDVVASAPRVSILSGAKVSRTRKVTAWVKRSNAVGKESERERRRG